MLPFDGGAQLLARAVGSRKRRHRFQEDEKERIEREYPNLKLNHEDVAEFEYQPGKCKRPYRVVVVRKNISKSGVNALRVPLYDLVSNGAYMVITALAWNLKSWFAMMMHRKRDRAEYIAMEFRRFLHIMILIPCRVVRRARGTTLRMLGYQPTPFLVVGLGRPRLCSLSVSITELAYSFLAGAAWRVVPALGRVAPALGAGRSKVARAVRARYGAADRMIQWAEAHRASDRPLLWIHAPSVGEGLQARAVVDALRAGRPDLQVVFTHFSPSAEALAARMPVDYAGPLPWDSPGQAGRAVEAVRPSAVVFTRTELWPVLAAAARERGAVTALVAATLPAGSSRLRWPARVLLRPTLGALDLVASVGAQDADRFAVAGARPAAVRVTGDPGVDSAASRARAADPRASHLRPFGSPARPTLVAGSTWPSDEVVLVAACTAVRALHPSVRLVIAPHEPEPAAVRALEARLQGASWRTARLEQVEAAGSVGDLDAVVVDRVGVLAELYTVGELAWVGGGFHGVGLHSVLEPAAAGLPVLFGPRHRGSRAAGELLAAGAAREVHGCADAVARLGQWLADPAARASAGRSAQGYINSHLGASGRTAEILSELIPRSSAR